MTIVDFLQSLLSVLNAMLPYLLLGFLIAGCCMCLYPKGFMPAIFRATTNYPCCGLLLLLQCAGRNRDSIASVAHHRRCV